MCAVNGPSVRVSRRSVERECKCGGREGFEGGWTNGVWMEKKNWSVD